MKEQLLELLQKNARLTNAELAVMLDVTEAEVADAIRALETRVSSRAIVRSSMTSLPTKTWSLQ